MPRILSCAGAGLALVVALSATSAMASADYYLEIKGTKGERRTTKIESFSWGATNEGAGRKEANPPEHHGVLQVVTAREAGSGLATDAAPAPLEPTCHRPPCAVRVAPGSSKGWRSPPAPPRA